MRLGLIGIKTEVFRTAMCGNHCNYTEYVLFPVITNGTGINNFQELDFDRITDFINDLTFRGNNKVEYGNRIVRITHISDTFIELRKEEIHNLITFPVKTNCIITNFGITDFGNLGKDILEYENGFFIDNIYIDFSFDNNLFISTGHATFNEITEFFHFRYHEYDLLKHGNPSIASNVLQTILTMPLSKSTIICNDNVGLINNIMLFWYTRKDLDCDLKLKNKLDFNK